MLVRRLGVLKKTVTISMFPMKVTVVIRAKIDVKNADAIQGQPEDEEFSRCNVELSIIK